MQSEILYEPGGRHQFGLTGQQDLYDYFSGRGRKKSKPKKGIARIIRKVSKPLSKITRKPVVQSKQSVSKPMRSMAQPIRTVTQPIQSKPQPVQKQDIKTIQKQPVPLVSRAVETPSPVPVEQEQEINDVIENTSPLEDQEQEESGETYPEESEEYGDSLEEDEGYDYFLGRGKKGKQKKQGNRNIRASRQNTRVERRSLKNDERRAGVERMRAETQVMQNMSNSPSPGPSGNASNNADEGNDGYKASGDNTGNTPEKESNSTLIIVAAVAGVIVVGVGLWMMSAGKQQAYATAA